MATEQKVQTISLPAGAPQGLHHSLHLAVLAEPAELEWPPERFLLEELQAPVALAALVALLGPAVLAEPAIAVQPAELAVLAELAEPEPLPDEDLHDEPGLEAFGLVYQPYYTNVEVVRFGREQ